MTTQKLTTQKKRFSRYDRVYDSNGFTFVDGPTILADYIIINNVALGDRVPNWRGLISSGQCATTDLAGATNEIESEAMSITSRRIYKVPAGYSIYGTTTGLALWLGTNGGTTSFPIAEAENRSLINLYSRLQSVETRFKGLVFSGELRESLGLIRHPARAFRNGIRDYLDHVRKHGSVLPKHKRKSFVRDSWLEYSFGWKPLISDLDSAIDAFYSRGPVRPIFEMVRGRGLFEIVESITRQSVAAGLTTIDYNVVDKVVAECRHYGIYRSDGAGVTNLHHAGFRPSEFVPTLWELIPYSFLVDYFSNIGKILESWSYRFNGLSWCSKGIMTERVREGMNFSIRSIPDSANESTTSSGSCGSYRSSRKNVNRYPNVPLDLPSLEFKVPGNWSQWINIASLSKNLTSARNGLNH